MHHIKPLHLCLSFIAVVCLVAFVRPVLSQTPTSDFPRVISNESFYAPTGDVSFAISNNAENIFTCWAVFGDFGGCSLWRRNANEEITGLDSIEAYWSIDNSRLVTMEKDDKCPSNTELYNVILFETQTGSTSQHCSSVLAGWDNWSPFQPHKLYMLHILDTDTFQTTSFSSPSKLSLTDIGHYWGYGETFWDLDTSLPVGKISLKAQTNLQNQITQSQLRICTLDVNDCQVLLDTLTVAPVDVFEYKLYKNWILWGGYLSATGQATNIYDDRADTALYLTNCQTGVTHELFRFSSLRQSNMYVNKFAWSPDGKSIGLAIAEIDDSSPLPTLPPEGTPMPTPTYPPGIVLLHLEWPASTNTD